MITTRFGQQLARGLTLAIVLALVVAGGLWWTLKDAGAKRVSAYFPSAIGLYEGNSVRVLGVDMGEVTKVEPQGERVLVEMTYDREVPIPAGAKAMIVAPSLVSDRYVQFAPAYTGGPQLDAGAVLSQERTEVPLEIDELSQSLSRVSESLGPKGANSEGSLSKLLDSTAANLDGNGKALHNTISKLGKAAGTLSGNSGDLFSTVENLAKLSKTLAGSDQTVRQFEQQLADVSGYLAGEKENLSKTVTELGTALQSVKGFIENNRGRIKSNVDKLASVTQVLVEQRGALAETLDIAPLALSNLANAYNASSGTLDTRPNLNELTQPPITMVCSLIKQVDKVGAVGDLCQGVADVADPNLPSLAQSVNALNQGKLPPLPLPVTQQVMSSGGGQ